MFAAVNTPNENTKDLYESYMTNSQLVNIPTISSGKYSLLLKMNPAILQINSMIEKRRVIEELGKKEWNCHVCKCRIRNLCQYVYIVDSQIKPIVYNDFGTLKSVRSERQIEIYELCVDFISCYIQECGNTPNWKFEIANESRLYSKKLYETKTFENISESYGWKHISYIPCKGICDSEYTKIEPSVQNGIWNNSYQRFEMALNKYFTLISKLLSKTNPNDELLNSMVLIRDLLSIATYGKEQLFATEWFIAIIQKIRRVSNSWNHLKHLTQVQLICDIIENSPITEGENLDAFIGPFHTINNYILNLLEKGDSPEAVVKMIETRNDPNKYKKKIAPPKQTTRTFRQQNTTISKLLQSCHNPGGLP